jgi:RNA polymerase sigma-70 factor (ECF subfamily)
LGNIGFVYLNPADAKKWMFTILRNHFLKWQRKKAPVQADEFENGIDYLSQLESVSMQQDVASVYERKIEAEAIQSILEKLPEKYKAVLILYYMEDSSYQEIAEMLALPIGTVMSRLSRAKQMMKNALLRSTINEPQARSGDAQHCQSFGYRYGKNPGWFTPW